jgi:hypothetical protein
MARRRFVYRPTDPAANERGFVEITAEVVEKRALDAPVLAGRFYENTASPIDGADIGSRRKHETYMREKNLALASDFSQVWAGQNEKRERLRREGHLPDRSRREDVGRALHKLYPE